MAVEKIRRNSCKRPSKQARRLAIRIARIENEVHEAMAVFNRKTGKLLKYCQLMQNPRYKEECSRSMANKFGRLTQGVDDWIKGTNHNEVHSQRGCFTESNQGYHVRFFLMQST